MAFYSDNMTMRIMEILSYPMEDRIGELSLMIDQCGLRDLQESFPIFVQSIFGVGNGNLGWGLRTTTKEYAPQTFSLLMRFFSSTGPWFRLCYRLLNDAIKFDFELDILPRKMVEMLQSGQYSMFYADLINVDPFQRQVTSLSLNAFDYYMLNFVIHGIHPLHKYYPVAMQVHSEYFQTTYFYLIGEYLNAFMPGNPDAAINPLNVCNMVKTPQPIPVQPLQPKRSPKYLKIPSSGLFASSNTSPTAVSPQMVHNVESSRAHAWRTETVLHFFIDVWFRFDIDEVRDLPSTEFVRSLRALVKHCHFFANSAHLDQSAMSMFRKMVIPMIKPHIYPFVRGLIDRWPLDTSLSRVMELWLSYLQPWRYTTATMNLHGKDKDVPIPSQFENFIAENLIVYTQIFNHFFPRFERLDYTISKNANMLYRLAKTFNHDILPSRLFQAEQVYVGNTFRLEPSPTHQMNNRLNKYSGPCEWDSYFNEVIYKPMFSLEQQAQVGRLMEMLYVTQLSLEKECVKLESILKKTNQLHGLFGKIKGYFFKQEDCQTEKTLRDLRGIVMYLNPTIILFGRLFDMEVPNWADDERPNLQDLSSSTISPEFLEDSGDYLNISQFSPQQMRNSVANASTTNIDPALLPVVYYENPFLVRFLHRVSTKINELYGHELQMLYKRPDLLGKIARQILYPPMTAQWFDKPKGVSELCQKELPPRICLRILASYHMITALVALFALVFLLTGNEMFACIFPVILFCFYVLIRALIS